MLSERSAELVDEAWAAGLGCPVDLVRTPGAHLVPGGPGLQASDAVYLVRIDDAVLVYCPEALRPAAHDVLGRGGAAEVFSVASVAGIAGGRLDEVRGPAWHGFVDAGCLIADPQPMGDRLSPDDDRLEGLRRACGDGEWEEPASRSTGVWPTAWRTTAGWSPPGT